jgi:hypothetical protein
MACIKLAHHPLSHLFTLDAGRTIPLPFGHQGPTHAEVDSIANADSCDVDHMSDTFSLISHDDADAASATASDCILKVSPAVVLTYDFHVKRSADPRERLDRIFPSPRRPCRQERKLSFLSASPLPRLQQRGVPHKKISPR